MDSERDELIGLIGDAAPSIPVKPDWERLADAILAAGYRRVDAEHVVVRREDAKDAAHCVRRYRQSFCLDESQEAGHFMLVEKNIRHALSADGDGTIGTTQGECVNENQDADSDVIASVDIDPGTHSRYHRE